MKSAEALLFVCLFFLSTVLLRLFFGKQQQKNKKTFHTLEKVFINSLFQRICSMLAQIGQQAPTKAKKNQSDVKKSDSNQNLQKHQHIRRTRHRTTITDQAAWRAGSPGRTAAGTGWRCTQSPELRRRGAPQRDRSPCSRRSRGRRRRRTPCCRSRRYGRRPAGLFCRCPEEKSTSGAWTAHTYPENK